MGIIGLARRHGYLSTTADAIATYHTALLVLDPITLESIEALQPALALLDSA